MRLSGRIVGVRSTEQSVGIKSGAFDPDIILCRIPKFLPGYDPC